MILYISLSYFICLVKWKNVSFFTQFLYVLYTLNTTLKKKVGYCRYHIEKRYLDDYHPNDDMMQEWRHKDFRILNLSFESNHWCFLTVFEWKTSITCFLKYHFNLYVCIIFFSRTELSHAYWYKIVDASPAHFEFITATKSASRKFLNYFE